MFARFQTLHDSIVIACGEDTFATPTLLARLGVLDCFLSRSLLLSLALRLRPKISFASSSFLRRCLSVGQSCQRWVDVV
jgi:hypothetical protein